jgi:hypothetical protein
LGFAQAELSPELGVTRRSFLPEAGTTSDRWGCTMKMIAEYVEHAIQFERMATEATDPALKESLAKQAVAYRKLAAERMHLPKSPQPNGAPP